MQIKKGLYSKTIEDIDKKHKIKRGHYLSITQLIEEIGRLARCINSPKFKRKELDKKNLNEEFANIFLQLCILPELYEVDLEKAIKNNLTIQEKRHGIETGK